MYTGDGYHRKRLHRHEIPGQARYLTFTCYRNQSFLNSDRTRQWFIDSLKNAKEMYPFDLWAFVLMLEHVHLLIRPAEGVTVKNILTPLKRTVSLKAVRWVRENCPAYLPKMMESPDDLKPVYHFWQPGGGHDRNIWSIHELHEKIRYIHANPVRRGLVEEPALWKWSSFAAWETGEDSLLPIDRETLPPLV